MAITDSAKIALENGGISTYTKTTREPNQELDKDAFLQLLVTQMKYQDPLNPMDNQQMMAQVAQFTALEQMKNVASTANKQLAHSMIGSYVQYTYKDTAGQNITDVAMVDYIKTSGEDVLLGVGEREIKVDEVEKVVNKDKLETASTAFDLLGRTVQASITQKIDTVDTKIDLEGQVLEVVQEDGDYYVVMGTGSSAVKIPSDNVSNIVTKPVLTDYHITGTTTKTETDAQGKTSSKQIEVEGIVQYLKTIGKDTYLYVYNKDANEYYTVKYEDMKTAKK